MRYVSLLVVFCLFVFSCSSEVKESEQEVQSVSSEEFSEEKMTVRLVVKAKPQVSIKIEQKIGGVILSDSVKTDENGMYSGKKQLDSYGFYRISSSNLPAALLIIDTDSIYVDMSDEKASFASIQNSKESTYFLEYQKLSSDFSEKFEKVRNNNESELALYVERKQAMRNYIEKVSPSFSALNALSEFYEVNELEFLKKIANKFESDEKEFAFAQPFIEGVKQLDKEEEASPSKIGNTVLNFELNNINGIRNELAQVKGKVILIDFWASWCGPCRQENPNLLKLYDKYREQGFEILSISTDSDLNAWKRAIEQDRMHWHHMLDKRDPARSVAAKYEVNAIPFTLLLDKNYKIIGKNLRGVDLEVKLAELFKP